MSTPLKLGIGKGYTVGEKFTLKSGNNPAFKMMGTPEAGDSPITNEFGIGKGTSPYRQEGEAGLGSWLKGRASQDDENKKGSGWKKAAQIGLAALTGGLDAVYGSGKIIPSSSARLIKKKKTDKAVDPSSPEEKIKKLTKNK